MMRIAVPGKHLLSERTSACCAGRQLVSDSLTGNPGERISKVSRASFMQNNGQYPYQQIRKWSGKVPASQNSVFFPVENGVSHGAGHCIVLYIVHTIILCNNTRIQAFYVRARICPERTGAVILKKSLQEFIKKQDRRCVS